MYSKIDGRLKAIEQIKLTSDSTTILLHIKTEKETQEVFKCPSESPNSYHMRKLLSSVLYIPSDIVCGNKDFCIQMTLIFLNFDNQHHIVVNIIFNNHTKEFKVITESTLDEQISDSFCTPGSSHYSIIEALFQKSTSTFEQGPKGKNLKDHNFPRHKQRNLHYQ